MGQFPLGLFAGAAFESRTLEVEPGDIRALLTDGLPEVANARDQEFGLERIGEIVAQNSDLPFADLSEILFATVRRYGRQEDDETLVLATVNLNRG